MQTSHGALRFQKFTLPYGQLADNAALTMSIRVITLHFCVTLQLKAVPVETIFSKRVSVVWSARDTRLAADVVELDSRLF